MKDNEKVILIVLGIIAVIVLPYFLYSKEAKVETAAIENECIELQTRYDYLYELDQNRDQYVKETEEFNEERDEIIAIFPADIYPAKTTLFLLDTEFSYIPEKEFKSPENPDGYEYGILPVVTGPNTSGTDKMYINGGQDIILHGEGIEDGLVYRYNYPIRFWTVSFGDNVETPIAKEGVDTGLWAVANSTSVSYTTGYDGFKYLLKYFMDYSDPMTYVSFSADYDREMDQITGEFVLNQFAIRGDDREDAPIDWEVENGWNVDVDEVIGGGRGNEETGIFGPPDPHGASEEEELETVNVEVVEEEE